MADESLTTLPIGVTMDLESATVRGFQIDVVDGEDAGRRWRSVGRVCVIGTAQSCDVIVSDPTVSRFHCEIRLDETGAHLRDTGSRNGTTVDGVRITGAYLRGGATIRVGHTTLRFDFGTEANRLEVSHARIFGDLVGESLSMRQTFRTLEKAARSDATVLLVGETGTGKTAAARGLHQASARRDGPFVILDAGAVPANLLESELLGHERGAFTGADSRRIGAFEEASGGTLFLDEIGELPLELQPKLLGALESRVIRRVGGSQQIPVDVRVVAATNRDLRREVNSGQFRADLYFRVAVIAVEMPALRDRPEDIEWIARRLLGELGTGAEFVEQLLTPDLLGRMQRATWTGNVRELRNYLERCVVLEQSQPFDDLLADIDLPVDTSLGYADAKKRIVGSFERRYLTHLLEEHKGSVSAAAAAAKTDRTHFYRLLRKHGLSPSARSK